ncbi:MAG: hypothetical protein ISQ24_02490 [PS1 clade bacterium]|nr:hypothetical protein [PS1 clade bacterium]
MSDLPIIGDFFDAAEIAESVIFSSYSELRDAMVWTEVGNTGLDTRDYMLAEQSLVPVVWNEAGTEVVSGKWEDINGFVSTDPEDFDIDHRVSFSEIVRQNPSFYDLSLAEQLEIYNDRENLQILHDVENREKSDMAAADYAQRILNPEGRAEFIADARNYWEGLTGRFRV